MTWAVIGSNGKRTEHDLRSGVHAAVGRHHAAGRTATVEPLPDAPPAAPTVPLAFGLWLDAQSHRLDDTGEFARWAKYALRPRPDPTATLGRWLYDVQDAGGGHDTQRAFVTSWREWERWPSQEP
jgi:hypothetical protein